jgi:hypothetical protein
MKRNEEIQASDEFVYYKIKRDTKDWEFEGFQDEFKKVYLGNE